MDKLLVNKKGDCYASGCEKPGNKYCSACKYAYYCSIECQKKDWVSHKDFCLKNREIKKNKDQMQALRLLNKLDRVMIRDMLAYLFYQTGMTLDDWGGVRLTINADFSGKEMTFLDLKQNSRPEPISKENMVNMLNTMYAQQVAYRDESLNSYDPDLFIFCIFYKGFGIVFSSPREDFQKTIDRAKEFSSKRI